MIDKFKMTVSDIKQQKKVENILQENGITPMDNCSNPWNHILFDKSVGKYITITDEWRYGKYSIECQLTFEEFMEKYEFHKFHQNMKYQINDELLAIQQLMDSISEKSLISEITSENNLIQFLSKVKGFKFFLRSINNM